MPRTTFQQRLSEAWRRAIDAGKIANTLIAPRDDPEGRWHRGDKVLLGLRFSRNEPEFYAFNETNSRSVELLVEERRVEGGTGFRCQFSEHRTLRPRSKSPRVGRQPDISSDAAECRFYCQQPSNRLSLLRREPLIQVRWKHFDWHAYYNAVPFERQGHYLWVPVIAQGETATIPHWPQRLSDALLEDLLMLCRECDEAIVLFNSLHAGASVNHLHAQAVFRNARLAVEDAKTTRYRGFTILEGYPADGFCFEKRADVAQVADCIQRLQRDEIPFNLVAVGERVVVVPRDIDHEIVAELPGDAPAGNDFAGKLIISNRTTYEHVDAERIERAFKKAALSTKQLLDRWKC